MKISDLFSVLEFDKILEKVVEEAFSEPGKEILKGVVFQTNPASLEHELMLVTEMCDCLKYDDAFPLESFPNFKDALKKSEVIGSFLRADVFLSLKRFLILVRQIKDFYFNRPAKYNQLQKRVKRLVPLPELEREINRIIGSSSEILDRASDKLYRIRVDIQKKESTMRKRLEAILHDAVASGFAQEDNLVLRDGRLVIPMKDSFQNKLKGMVVDQSSSGATLFMEPIETVEMNNEIRKLKVQEKLEEEEILRALTSAVRDNRITIQENQDIAAELDSISAKARFSIKIHGCPGFISQNGIIDLKGARHPLLLSKLGKDKVVPLDLKMGGELKTIVVTGPNAGGKTVTLKTVGILALMHQHGFHISADEGSSLPLFSELFADIGDRQSIEQDLSTFSSHIQMIKAILDRANQKSLVLLDEIGSATDPEEGAALARSILNDLTRMGCLTMATTHMGALKIFAHETAGVDNASMAFDQKTLRPVYQFQMGIPGSSYAFEIAQRLGLSEALIHEARLLAGAEKGKLDTLISDLERERRRVYDLLSNAEIQESRLSGLMALYQDKIAKAREEGEKEKQILLEEAENVLKETNRQAENIIRQLRENEGKPEIVKTVRMDLTEQKKRIQALKRKEFEKPAMNFSPGDWVVWQRHGGRAQVLSRTAGKGKIWIQWESLKLQIPVHECRPAVESIPQGAASPFVSYSIDNQIKDELDLRGMTVDESIEALERYLPDASVAGLTQVRIIHGKGTGVLRREINKYLKNQTLIKNQRLGNWNEGDTGVTIVELK